MSVIAERTTPAKKPAKRALPLGSMIDNLWQLREDKRKSEAATKLIEKDIEAAETELLERLDKEGMDKATGRLGTISIGEALVGTIEDWDAFTAFLAKTKNFQLVQRRISDVAYRELLGMGKPVPGIKPFTKRKLNLRSVTS